MTAWFVTGRQDYISKFVYFIMDIFWERICLSFTASLFENTLNICLHMYLQTLKTQFKVSFIATYLSNNAAVYIHLQFMGITFLKLTK